MYSNNCFISVRIPCKTWREEHATDSEAIVKADKENYKNFVKLQHDTVKRVKLKYKIYNKYDDDYYCYASYE